jgi:hypothetical protein
LNGPAGVRGDHTDRVRIRIPVVVLAADRRDGVLKGVRNSGRNSKVSLAAEHIPPSSTFSGSH